MDKSIKEQNCPACAGNFDVIIVFRRQAGEVGKAEGGTGQFYCVLHR